MDISRQSEHNKATIRIRDLNKCIQVDEGMMEALKQQGDIPYVRAQIAKITSKNEERKKEISDLEKRIEGITRGDIDSEIVATNKSNYQEQKNKNAIQKQKKEESRLKNADNHKLSMSYNNMTRDSDRQERNLKREMDRSYSYFKKIDSTVPEYIETNLKDMPNTKGYFWRGIACFGEKEPDFTKPLTLFEREKGGVLLIHEYYRDVYNLYKKKGKDRKKLEYTEPRRERMIPRHIQV